MSTAIQDAPLIASCPPSIADDVNVQAVCIALDRQFKETIDAIVETLIIPAINTITSDDLLEVLAWQFHVDTWSNDDSIEIRRRLIINSLPWHARKGTPALLQEVCDTFFEPGAAVIQEWFEYKVDDQGNLLPPNYPIVNPDPPVGDGLSWHDRYRFRILADETTVTPEIQARAEQLIYAYKPISRWPEATVRARRSDLDIYWGAASLTWKYIIVDAPPLGAPVVNDLSPPEAPPFSDLRLEVIGTNFFFTSVIYFNNNPIVTSFVDSEHLITTNTFNVGDLGNKPVFVRTNMADSNTLNFIVTAEINPILALLIPNTSLEGEEISFSVEGFNFQATSVIVFDGVELATTFVSANHLDADDLLAVGLPRNVPVLVRTGTLDSNVVNFAVTAKTIITQLIPNISQANHTLPMLTVLGQNFLPVSVIVWDGLTVATTFVNSGEIHTTLPLDVGANARAVPVYVTDPRFETLPPFTAQTAKEQAPKK
jgi:phage tail P2-like protein